MKKQIIMIAMMVFGTITMFAQISKGDVDLIQKYFGVEKAALLQDYMKFTPAQDSAFWPIYNKYEAERLELGAQRIALVDDYLKNVQNMNEASATAMVDKGIALEMKFKSLQKKYFTSMAKKIGPVKAAQFYQFENYINNVINLSIQESIPFVGDLEQKADAHQKK